MTSNAWAVALTGLDYFGARYFSGAQGRFTSPDEPLLDQDESDPQSWNLYAYVRNNPLRFFDPTGRACVSNGNGGWKDDDSGGQSCADVEKADKDKKPDVTVTGSPMPITVLSYLGFDRAYVRAVGQQAEIDMAAGRWDRVPILRGEMPLGPPAVEGANAIRGIWSRTNKLSAGLDPAQDEAASRRAEKVGKLPGKPTPEALKAIERILKKKEEEQQ